MRNTGHAISPDDVTLKNKAWLLAGALCVVMFSGALMRLSHLRSIHRTPHTSHQICGGELVPCDAIGLRNLAPSSNYDACWEVEQSPPRSATLFEAMELTVLRKVDEAQCAVQGSLSRAVMRR